MRLRRERCEIVDKDPNRGKRVEQLGFEHRPTFRRFPRGELLWQESARDSATRRLLTRSALPMTILLLSRAKTRQRKPPDHEHRIHNI